MARSAAVSLTPPPVLRVLAGPDAPTSVWTRWTALHRCGWCGQLQPLGGCPADNTPARLVVGRPGMEDTTNEAASVTEQSAADYLQRHSVTLIMHDLLAVLLENRPADPIDFISDYFDHVAQGDAGDPIERCCRYIRLSKPGARPCTMCTRRVSHACQHSGDGDTVRNAQPWRCRSGAKSFMDNLAAAYATLDLHHGLTTNRLAELIRHMCRCGEYPLFFLHRLVA